MRPNRPAQRLSRFAILALPGLLMVNVGCGVSQGEHNKVKIALANCESFREQLQAELQQERAQSSALQGQLSQYESRMQEIQSLARRNQMEADQYRQEVGSLRSTARELNARIADIANRPPMVIETPSSALPAELDSQLKQFARANQGVVEYDSRSGVVRFKSDLTFGLGSWELGGSVQPVLARFASIVRGGEAGRFDIVVVGHTDAVPISAARRAQVPSNTHLSAFRAIAVRNKLISEGIEPARVAIAGYGEHQPVAPNPPGGNEKNRRVEILLVPAGTLAPQKS